MKINDAVFGACFLLLGVAVLVARASFPTIPGQNVGPALFPGIIAVGLSVCGVLLDRQRLRAPRSATPWFERTPWMRSPRHVLAFVVARRRRTSFYILSPTRSAS